MLGCERYLPGFLLSKFSSQLESLTISLNQKRFLPSNVINRKEILDGIIGRQGEKDVEEERSQADVSSELREAVLKIKREMDNMAVETAEIKKMLTVLVEKQEIDIQM